ncbi:MAG TPA: hypothetical protein PKD86_03345 [Gemmatales bacterium]|nr:hypothetical protein [Gemmatales bacterium]
MERMPRLVMLMLLTALAGCCAWPDAIRPSTGWLPSWRSAWPSQAPDGPSIDLAVVQEPVSAGVESFLAGALWLEADEQVLPIEQLLALDEHGLRVGIVPQHASAALQKMLANQEACPTARRLTSRTDEEATWPLAKRTEPVDIILASATELSFRVRLRGLDDGRTLVRIVPAIQHGAPAEMLKPRDDRSGWEIDRRQPEHRLEDLDLAIELGPHDFLILGYREGRVGSFGHVAFSDTEARLQRVLVIRAVPRPSPGPSLSPQGPTPLALQTVWSNPGRRP